MKAKMKLAEFLAEMEAALEIYLNEEGEVEVEEIGYYEEPGRHGNVEKMEAVVAGAAERIVGALAYEA